MINVNKLITGSIDNLYLIIKEIIKIFTTAVYYHFNFNVTVIEKRLKDSYSGSKSKTLPFSTTVRDGSQLLDFLDFLVKFRNTHIKTA